MDAMDRGVPEARVEWHEGLLLAPQHFQLMSARVDSLVAWQTLAAAPFSWGLRRIEFDPGLLVTGRLRVLTLSAILPDGLTVGHDAQSDPDSPLELALAPWEPLLDRGQPLDVYLSVPVAEVAVEGRAGRMRSIDGGMVEDRVSQSPAVPVPRLVPRLGLSAGEVPGPAFTHLRLGTLVKRNGVLQLGARLPPLLMVQITSALWRDSAALLGALRMRAGRLARQITGAWRREDDVLDRLDQLERREQLHALLSALPQAEAVLRTPRLHPWPLYVALASLTGALAALRPGVVPAMPPDYDHGDPSRVFDALLRSLEEAMPRDRGGIRPIRFEVSDGGFSLRLDPAWRSDRLVLAARGPDTRGVRAWMSGAAIGDVASMPSLLGRRVLGATRRPLSPETAAALAAGLVTDGDALLFEVDAQEDLVTFGDVLRVVNGHEGANVARPAELWLCVAVPAEEQGDHGGGAGDGAGARPGGDIDAESRRRGADA